VLLFSILYGVWLANYIAFNGDVVRELAAQLLALAEKQAAAVPLMIGHRLVGTSLLLAGDIAESRAHFDEALALYDPAEHRLLATRFGQDHRVSVLLYRSIALGMLGHLEAGLADADHALKEAREIGHAATLMFALTFTTRTLLQRGNYAAANLQIAELLALANEKGALFWKAYGMCNKGLLSALTAKPRTQFKRSPPASAHCGLQEQPCRCRLICYVWRGPMRNTANSMTLGAVSTKRRRRSLQPRKGGSKRRSIAWLAKSQ
jgi:tetratricopeptide (TPR) repeat protein